MTPYRPLLGLSDDDLGRVDPLVTNLLVAKSIPSISGLDLGRYQRQRDDIAEGVKKRLPHAERVFAQSPHAWKNDVNFIRLAVLCEYLDREVGIKYNEDQKDAKKVRYTNPSDLFLNGISDTKQGTCGNMAALQMVVGWRLGWPVSLACVQSHFILRYDDGLVTYNIDATVTGRGGFSARNDQWFIDEYKLTPRAISSGSDLRALKPRELLGVWLGLRGRHMKDVGEMAEAERDGLLARHLFPANRDMYFGQMWASVQQSTQRFEDYEEGTPSSFAAWVAMHYGTVRPVRAPAVHQLAPHLPYQQFKPAEPRDEPYDPNAYYDENTGRWIRPSKQV